MQSSGFDYLASIRGYAKGHKLFACKRGITHPQATLESPLDHHRSKVSESSSTILLVLESEQGPLLGFFPWKGSNPSRTIRRQSGIFLEPVSIADFLGSGSYTEAYVERTST
jgi:hypothetical protein